MTRREWLPLAGAGLLAGFAGTRSRKHDQRTLHSRTRVGVYKTASYDDDLAVRIQEGARDCGLVVKDQKALVHAHLEGFRADHSLNADATVVAATVRALRAIGASEVIVGAGPSLERDTMALAEAAGYRDAMGRFEKDFVDLNRDDVSFVEGFPQGPLYLPVTALRADLIVSVAKMKTDAQAGVALSLGHLSGLLPGSVYGWPRTLRWARI